MQKLLTSALGARQTRRRRLALVLTTALLLAACGSDEEAASTGDAPPTDDVGALIASSATISTCGFSEEFERVIANVELVNPLTEPAESIFVYVHMLDADGELLESTSATFLALNPGATATEMAPGVNLSDPAIQVSCEVVGGAVS